MPLVKQMWPRTEWERDPGLRTSRRSDDGFAFCKLQAAMSDLKDMKSIDSGSTHLEHGQPRLISAHLDAAAQVVDHDQPLEVSIEEDKRVLRLIDKYVLIPLMLVYFLRKSAFF